MLGVSTTLRTYSGSVIVGQRKADLMGFFFFLIFACMLVYLGLGLVFFFVSFVFLIWECILFVWEKKSKGEKEHNVGCIGRWKIFGGGVGWGEKITSEHIKPKIKSQNKNTGESFWGTTYVAVHAIHLQRQLWAQYMLLSCSRWLCDKSLGFQMPLSRSVWSSCDSPLLSIAIENGYYCILYAGGSTGAEGWEEHQHQKQWCCILEGNSSKVKFWICAPA